MLSVEVGVPQSSTSLSTGPMVDLVLTWGMFQV